jgi:hypothetical protein
LKDKQVTLKKNHQIDTEIKDENYERTHMFGTLRVKLRRLHDQISELKTTLKNPIIEYNVNLEPKFITNYQKNIFICDQNGNLCVYELSESLQLKTSIKLGVNNIRCLSANKKYLAISFSDLNMNEMQEANKIYRKLDSNSGVLIFKFGDSYSILAFEKIISSYKNFKLLSPAGIGLHDSYLIVCDRELHGVFKIDIKTGGLIQRLITSDQEPICLSIGEKYFAYTDALKLEMHLVDLDKFNVVRTTRFSDELFIEPFEVTLRENSIIFAKNKADCKVILYDSNFNIKYSFDYDGSNTYGMHFSTKLKKDLLILGCKKYDDVTRSNRHFKIGVFTEF